MFFAIGTEVNIFLFFIIESCKLSGKRVICRALLKQQKNQNISSKTWNQKQKGNLFQHTSTLKYRKYAIQQSGCGLVEKSPTAVPSIFLYVKGIAKI